MKIHLSNKSLHAIPGALKMAGGVAAACVTLLAAAPSMAETVVSGQSDTIIRMGQSLEKKNVYPAYEYLRLSITSADKDGSATSFHLGGWLRGDMGEKSARDRSTDADLQYGYVSYQGAKNNLIINAGRQFVTEGIATERLDGLYVRNDFAAGFAAATFVGSPTKTEPNLRGDDLIFGGRVTQSNYKYYTLGISALKSFSDDNRYREEEGLDLWLHPIKQVDVTGRSSYNSMTEGWMEHAYALSYTPNDSIRFSADLSRINYKDYFYKVTTSALIFNPLTNGIDPNEKVLAVGGSIAYSPIKSFTIAADYKNYKYDIAKSAQYSGLKATASFPESFSAGFSVHRMDGEVSKLKYNEIRLFASKKIKHLDLATDLMTVSYDSPVNGVKTAYTVVGSASYEFTESVKLGADVDYSRNPDFNNEVKGLIKLTYLFDTKHAAEGRAK